MFRFLFASLLVAVALFAIPSAASAQSDDDIEIETIDVDSAAVQPQSTHEFRDTADAGDLAEFEAEVPPAMPGKPRYERVVRKGQVITGACLSGVPWVFSMLGAMIVSSISSSGCSDCGKIAEVLWIPVAGPALTEFIDDREGLSPAAPLMFLWTGAQAAGAVILVTGLAGRMETVESDHVSFTFEPVIRRGGVGLALNVEFRAHGG